LRRDHAILAGETIAASKSLPAVEPLIRAGIFECELQFEPGTAAEFGLILYTEAGDEIRLGYLVAEQQLFLDRRQSGLVDFHEVFASRDVAPLELPENHLTLHLFVDWSSLEVFANGGRVVLTDLIFPRSPWHKLDLYANSGQAGLKQGTVWALASIWEP
jgi:fructan beta-fructosidase